MHYSNSWQLVDVRMTYGDTNQVEIYSHFEHHKMRERKKIEQQQQQQQKMFDSTSKTVVMPINSQIC